MKNRLILTCVSLLMSFATIAKLPITVTGPDGNLSLSLQLENGKTNYIVDYNGMRFLQPSSLGLKTSLGDFSQQLTYSKHSITSVSYDYELLKNKVSHVQHEATNLLVSFTTETGDFLDIEFRLANNDLAFRYIVRSGHDATRIKVFSETSSFNLPDDATSFITPQALPETGWMQTKPSYEEGYTFDEPVGTPSANGVGYTFPALFKNNQKGWILISETDVDSTYVGSRLSESTKHGEYGIAFPQEGENSGIGATYAAMALPATTPWRTITIGQTLAPIVETTQAFDLVLPRYPASQDYKMGRASWSWIVWQDDSINYDDQIKYIDLASELDLEYVLIDNWWDRNIGRDKIVELVNYAKQKNVGVLLWYNSNGWWNDAPQTPQNAMNTAPARQNEMQWLQEIGVKGLKVDFFGGDKQDTIKLYEDIFTDANKYGLTITVHGSTIPRGWERMYPNFVTSEAVLASENLIFTQRASDLHAFNATILPFTRNTIGAMDFAPVFLNKRLSRDQVNGSIRRTTEAFELATGILYLSPVQHFGLTPNNLEEQPDFVLDLIKEMPAVWDETRFIDGYPGSHAVIARRKGSKWYVAAVNGEDKAKKITLNLSMLKGKSLHHIFDKHNGNADYEGTSVNNNGQITLSLQPQGGAVLYSKE
ncbi:glycoside hydrolase family 97 catalytic domain-containing protein [Glaciecola sp. 1036]|uniref:glycoside hydrolase family 97 protein n=1 Tax=Alteromonadaceae TaxID=72275 RepID=UPI003D04AFC1